ncbi:MULTISPECIES: TadE family protein [Metallibacterium]|jgi:hypothetical protein|uniref:TadE family protein n=1 Tax=Metallibacterium TaxID=1218803 RepID=UPI00261B5817|nr:MULTISPECIES: TadE family protein [Metallibacterium]MBW8074788.1 hypothetical protein [Metallibacterium scheffleri]
MRTAQHVVRVRARGQSMVEFIVILPTLLLLTLGIIQFAQIYIAKNTLDLAAFEGVRAGTLNNAKVGAIKCGIAQGLLPLYGGNETPSVSGTAGAAIACGFALAGPLRYIAAFSKAFVAVDNPVPGASDYGAMDLNVLNPTAADFDAFGETIANQQQIPNSRLMWRSTTINSGAGMNIQDANLLMIRVQYCYPMDVLFIKQIVQGLAIGADKMINTQTTFGTECYTSGGVPLVAQTTMLMQSPAYPPSG